MTEQRSLIRASDLGLWTYCQRAWWLARVHNAPHQYPKRLAHGTTVHDIHSQTMARAQRYRQWAHMLLACGLLLMGIALLVWLMQDGI